MAPCCIVGVISELDEAVATQPPCENYTFQAAILFERVLPSTYKLYTRELDMREECFYGTTQVSTKIGDDIQELRSD